MQEHLPRNIFDIPKLFYFQAGNVHTASRAHLRYRVEPAEGELHIEYWLEDICYELARERGIVSEPKCLPISQEGFDAMLEYLQGVYDSTKK